MPQQTFELLDGSALMADNTAQNPVVYLREVKQFNPTTFAFQDDTQPSELFPNTLNIQFGAFFTKKLHNRSTGAVARGTAPPSGNAGSSWNIYPWAC